MTPQTRSPRGAHWPTLKPPLPFADERRKASACFAGVAHPSARRRHLTHTAFQSNDSPTSPTGPPPPPDLLETRSRAAEIHAQREQMRRGENDVYPAPGTTEYETFINEDRQALVQVKELIKELGNTQPILKSLLDTAVVELEEHVSSPGRQLLQREDYSYLMTDSLSEHALQKSVGLRGIPGLTSFSCEALCSAVAAEADANCKAFAFKRSDPWSRTDLTGSCHLLKNSGGCKVADFATVRRPRATSPIPSAQRLSPRATGTLHTVLRVGAGVFGAHPRIRFGHVHRTTGDDRVKRGAHTRRCCSNRVRVRSAPFELTLHPTDPVLCSHLQPCRSQAASPDPQRPGCWRSPRATKHFGSNEYAAAPSTPSHHTPLSHHRSPRAGMVAFARQQGVTSYWAATPNTAAGDVTTHWIEPSGKELVYRKGEKQCILVASGLGRNEKVQLPPCRTPTPFTPFLL